jgi:hypothetical protein
MPPLPRGGSRRRTPTLILLVSLILIACGWIILGIAGQQPQSDTSAEIPHRPPTNGRELVATPAVPTVTDTAGDTHSTPRCIALPPHVNVSSVLENFYLCFDEEACSGTLRFDFIDRTICTTKRRALSANTSLSNFLSDVIGPDLFRFRLDGPETVTKMVGASTTPVDELIEIWHSASPSAVAAGRNAPCSYSVVIPELRFGGTYRVGLEWLYRDYAAMDELTGHWPPLLKQTLLEVDPAFSTKYHLQQCTLPSTATVTCKKPPLSSDRDAGMPPPRHLCTGLERDTSGRWVTEVRLAGSPVYTRVRVKKIQRSPIIFQWALQPDIARQWWPSTCAMVLPALSTTPHALPTLMSALSKTSQRIVIGGDSQLRALYFGMSNFMSGFSDTCLRNITTETAEPRHCIANVKGSQRKVIQGVQLDFVDDLFLDRFTSSERYSGYHTIIVGFAQHPASKEHWTFDKYRQSFASKLRRALQLKAAGKHVVWYLAPQYPHTTNGFPVHVRDWRTDLRLKMFNTFAKRECQAHDIAVVDGFDISTPFSHTSPDQAHFSNFVSHELVRMSLTVVCSHYGGCQQS